jgi:hypothetical protein
MPMAAVGAFTTADLATRAGRGCQEHTEQASGAGAAAAVAVHRFLERSAIALAGSAAHQPARSLPRSAHQPAPAFPSAAATTMAAVVTASPAPSRLSV